jgi:hypothetical protein
MGKNNLFKTLLIVQTVGLLIYTLIVLQTEGVNFIAVFVSNVKSLAWTGQFSLDFQCYLILSGLWIMWRDKFSSSSIIIGLIAMIFGIIVFAPYLLWLIVKDKNDIKNVLIGKR